MKIINWKKEAPYKGEVEFTKTEQEMILEDFQEIKIGGESNTYNVSRDVNEQKIGGLKNEYINK